MAEQSRVHQRRRGDPFDGGIYDTEEDGDPAVRCTGKNCQSCTAGVIADCVALCCCPCAVVNLLTLVIVKIPWMMGRRLCSRGLARSRKKKNRKTKCLQYESEVVAGEPRREKVDEDNVSNVWLEFHPVGHLSFGRVSFTGIQFPCSAEEQREKLYYQ